MSKNIYIKRDIVFEGEGLYYFFINYKDYQHVLLHVYKVTTLLGNPKFNHTHEQWYMHNGYLEFPTSKEYVLRYLKFMGKV